MTTFLFLLSRFTPFYLIALVGYIAGKKLNIGINSISKIYFYIFQPVVVFYGTQQISIYSGDILLPAIYFLIATILTIFFLYIGAYFFKDSTKYLFALTGSVSNVGNFGLPLAIALFGIKAAAPAIFAVVGAQIHTFTVGYFVASKGNYSTKQSIIGILKLPSVYAFISGILLQLIHIDVAKNFIYGIATQFVSAYFITGLLIVGLGIAATKHKLLDKKYLTLSLIAAFVVWPITMVTFIFLDKSVLHLLSEFSRKILFIHSLAPIGINIIVLGSILKLHPEKGAVAVAISTLIALIYIPIMLSLFLHYL